MNERNTHRPIPWPPIIYTAGLLIFSLPLLAELYRRSGRTCGTTSGLWQAFRAECLESFAQSLAERARERWARDQEVLVLGDGEVQP